MGKRTMRRLLLTIGAMLALAGGALAYFTATGSGASTASANITLSAVTVTGATGTQSLLPTGSPTGDLNVILHNGNAGRIHLSSLVLDTSQGTSGFSANAASCALSFATQNNTGSGWTIAAGGSLPVDLTSSVTMGTTAASSCQGQTFTVYLKAS
jgi:hypothetical protein